MALVSGEREKVTRKYKKETKQPVAMARKAFCTLDKWLPSLVFPALWFFIHFSKTRAIGMKISR